MEYDAFLKLDNIEGESSDDKYSGQIEVVGFSLGVDQPSDSGSSAKGAAGFGRAEFNDFKILKYLDKASANLFKACANGTLIGSGTFTMCQATGQKQEVLKIDFKNLMVGKALLGKNIDFGDFDNIEPEKLNDVLEVIYFKYAEIQKTYTETDHDTGASKGNIQFGYNVAKNTSA